MPSWIPDMSYHVVIEPRRITFVNGNVRVEVAPRLCVGEDGRLLGVGDERPGGGGGRVIELFEPAQPDEPPRFDALVSFFRYVMAVTMESTLFKLRPLVQVRGAALLRPLLHGYEEELIRHALLQAGAAKVVFAA